MVEYRTDVASSPTVNLCLKAEMTELFPISICKASHENDVQHSVWAHHMYNVRRFLMNMEVSFRILCTYVAHIGIGFLFRLMYSRIGIFHCFLVCKERGSVKPRNDTFLYQIRIVIVINIVSLKTFLVL